MVHRIDESIQSDTLHMLDYIVEWAEVISELTDEQLESPRIQNAIRTLYNAMSDFEDTFSKVQEG